MPAGTLLIIAPDSEMVRTIIQLVEKVMKELLRTFLEKCREPEIISSYIFQNEKKHLLK